ARCCDPSRVLPVWWYATSPAWRGHTVRLAPRVAVTTARWNTQSSMRNKRRGLPGRSACSGGRSSLERLHPLGDREEHLEEAVELGEQRLPGEPADDDAALDAQGQPLRRPLAQPRGTGLPDVRVRHAVGHHLDDRQRGAQLEGEDVEDARRGLQPQRGRLPAVELADEA